MLTGPLIVVGTYDPGKARARVLLAGLRSRGVLLHEVNVGIWEGVRDKGLLTPAQKLRAAWRQIMAMPRLAVGYWRAPAHSSVLILYPGVVEALLIAPLAALRGARVTLDLFISPFDTMVHDRRTHAAWHPFAALLFALEWTALRCVSSSFLDTSAHARRIEQLMGLPPGRIGRVPLGTDPSRLLPRPRRGEPGRPLRVLFYGQYIPLHGMETIVRAARRLQDSAVPAVFTFAGTGQEMPRISELIAELGVRNIQQLGWIESERLPELMHEADIGLGIFGSSAKARSVVPNKAYEMAAAQLPFISGDTPAMQEFAQRHPWIILIEVGNDLALTDAIAHVAAHGLPTDVPQMPVIGPGEVADALLEIFGAEH